MTDRTTALVIALASVSLVAGARFIGRHFQLNSPAPAEVSVEVPEVTPAYEPKLGYMVWHRYAVVQGGVFTRKDWDAAVEGDPVVRKHYEGFVPYYRTFLESDRANYYVSYRKGEQIYWTKGLKHFPRGTAVVVSFHGELIRAGCGNRLSITPRQPTEPKPDPQLEEQSTTDFRMEDNLKDDGSTEYLGLKEEARKEAGTSTSMEEETDWWNVLAGEGPKDTHTVSWNSVWFPTGAMGLLPWGLGVPRWIPPANDWPHQPPAVSEPTAPTLPGQDGDGPGGSGVDKPWSPIDLPKPPACPEYVYGRPGMTVWPRQPNCYSPSTDSPVLPPVSPSDPGTLPPEGAVPEPGEWGLLGAGLVLFSFMKRGLFK